MTTITRHELGRVNSDGTYAVHSVAGGAPFAATLMFVVRKWSASSTAHDYFHYRPRNPFTLCTRQTVAGTIALTDVT